MLYERQGAQRQRLLGCSLHTGALLLRAAWACNTCATDADATAFLLSTRGVSHNAVTDSQPGIMRSGHCMLRHQLRVLGLLCDGTREERCWLLVRRIHHGALLQLGWFSRAADRANRAIRADSGT